MVRAIALTLAGLIASALWLSLLVASGFQGVAIGVGLLGMLILLNISDRRRIHE